MIALKVPVDVANLPAEWRRNADLLESQQGRRDAAHQLRCCAKNLEQALAKAQAWLLGEAKERS